MLGLADRDIVVYVVQDVARAEEARCDHVMHFELAVSELLSIGCCNMHCKVSLANFGSRRFGHKTAIKNTRNDK